jgi:hypothetical protein
VAINLEFESYREIIDFIQNEKDLLFTETLNEIKNSIKNNEKIANVANLMVNDDVITINVEKSDWSSHLNFSIAYFERIEDYETCIEINNILKGL